jgi:hypothetical protein
MSRYRIRIVNVADRAEELAYANRVREALIERAEVWLDPDHPLQGVHRDTEGHAYFEFAAENRATLSNVLYRNGQEDRTELTETNEPLGKPCQNCGNIAGPVQPPECPNCGFLEIGRCPVCGELNSLQNYERISGNLYYCPTRRNGTRHRVRLVFNEPMLRLDGNFNQPLVLVMDAVRR